MQGSGRERARNRELAVGVFGVCYGGFVFVAPTALLHWFKGTATTNGRIRTFGAFMLGVAMILIWAGASEEGSFDLNGQSTLAFILSLIGWVWVVVMTTGLVLFPGFYRAIIHTFVPSELSGSLIGWRLLGLVRIAISAPFVYFGALAL